MEPISDRERAFLAAIRAGATIAAASASLGYSAHWGKWKSRDLRRRLGAETIREAVAMADEDSGVSRADFEKLTGLVSRLGDSLEELAKRPNDPGRQEQVQQRELDVKDHAKALGLSLDDVERLKGEKEYERWKGFEERRLKELADEEEPEEEPENGAAGKGVGDRILDGLGGIRNVKP